MNWRFAAIATFCLVIIPVLTVEGQTGESESGHLQLAVREVLEAADHPSSSGLSGDPGIPQAKLNMVLQAFKAVRQEQHGLVSKGLIVELQNAYRSLGSRKQYQLLLLRDIARRLMLAEIQAGLAGQPTKADIEAYARIVDEVAVSPEALLVFTKAGWSDGMPKAREGAVTLEEAFSIVCRSHNLKGTQELMGHVIGSLQRSAADGEEWTLERLLVHEDRMLACYQIVQTEMVRAVMFRGTIEFLRRGGDAKRVDASDIRYFREILPREQAKQFAFEPTETKALSAVHVLIVLQPQRNDGERPDAPWMKPVFSGNRRVENE